MIVSCDPGVKGALAFYDWKTGQLDIKPMPIRMRTISGKKNRRAVLDEGEIVALMRWWADLGAKTLFIEQVGGVPGQSAPAAFSFGQGYGIVITAAVAAGMDIETVPPSRWKADMKVPANKNEARARASQMIPTHRHLWTYAKDDGLAEVALLALYAWKIVTGGVQRSQSDEVKIEKARAAREASVERKKVKAAAFRARHAEAVRNGEEWATGVPKPE